jgi:hypothetical protein
LTSVVFAEGSLAAIFSKKGNWAKREGGRSVRLTAAGGWKDFMGRWAGPRQCASRPVLPDRPLSNLNIIDQTVLLDLPCSSSTCPIYNSSNSLLKSQSKLQSDDPGDEASLNLNAVLSSDTHHHRGRELETSQKESA